jgi:hypothetical protein
MGHPRWATPVGHPSVGVAGGEPFGVEVLEQPLHGAARDAGLLGNVRMAPTASPSAPDGGTHAVDAPRPAATTYEPERATVAPAAVPEAPAQLSLL